jgi:hypothetical protein
MIIGPEERGQIRLTPRIGESLWAPYQPYLKLLLLYPMNPGPAQLIRSQVNNHPADEQYADNLASVVACGNASWQWCCRVLPRRCDVAGLLLEDSTFDEA